MNNDFRDYVEKMITTLALALLYMSGETANEQNIERVLTEADAQVRAWQVEEVITEAETLLLGRWS